MPTAPTTATSPRWAPWALVAVTLLGAGLRLPGLTAEEPWFDEVFSLVLAAQDLPLLLRRAIDDQTNPPGFYLLLWGWTHLGGLELAWSRLLPALAGTLTVPAVALAARTLGLGTLAALVAALLAATSPLLLAMSSELRAYAPLALVTALALAAVAAGRPRAFGLAALALVSLHYFGALVVAALVIGARWHDRALGRRCLVAALPAAAALGAWLLLVAREAGDRGVGANAAWIGPPGLDDLPSFASQVVGTFGTRAGAFAVLAAVLAALFAAALVAARAARLPGAGLAPSLGGGPAGTDPSGAARLLLAAAIVPVLAALALSLGTGRGLWVARYLIIVLPPLWLLLAAAAVRAPRRVRAGCVAALAAWALLAGPLAEAQRTRRSDWSLVARALTAGGPRVVCTNEPFVGLPLQYQAVRARLPLTVRDLGECLRERDADAILLRDATDASLRVLQRAGADVGPPRALGTRLPETRIRAIRWRVP